MKRLAKLKSLSFDEIRVRGSQAFSVFCERRGWSSIGKLPSDRALLGMLESKSFGGDEIESAAAWLKHYQTRSTPRFFSGFADREVTVKEFRRRWPEGANEVIAHANRILDGKFDLLGLRNLSFGDPIDWQLEPVAARRTPLLHWSRLDYLDSEVAGDKKIIWELNRHQYFAMLGQAYWLTGDEKYAQTFADHLDSWMDQNPPKLGINWASSLEVAFRSISWLWAFYFFKDSPSLSANTYLRALGFLYLNARHLEAYLSTYFSPNTHLTGEALGLFYLGTLLPELNAARRWRDLGAGILLEQLPRHVRADGTYFEQTSYYHRYTTDFYTHFMILARLNGYQLNDEVEIKLKALLNHLMYITRPDGTTPFFGDDDGGRLVMLDHRQSNDFRAALSTGAVLFERGDYKRIAGGAAEETLWLLGPNALQDLDSLATATPARQSIAFSDGGYYVMRDGWESTSNYLMFDCGPHGHDNCGHAHSDALSFELAVQGRTMLADIGTFTYTGSTEWRDFFRSSPAHNTLTVDTKSSSESAGPFSWKTIANSETNVWITRDRFDYVAGKHDGYSQLAAPVAHTRTILFLKDDYWIMQDEVSSASEHQYDLWFHFNDQTSAKAEGRNALKVNGPTGLPELGIWVFAAKGEWSKEEGWLSHCYGQKEPAPVGVFSARAIGEDFVTFMLPLTGGSERQVRAIEAIGGRAFEVVSERTVDVVMIRDDGRVETARLASDFELTWARFSSDGDSLPEELVLIGGKRLALEGREILKSEKRINYLVATRKGDQFRVETDDRVLDLSLLVSDLEALFASSNRQSEL